MKAGTSSPNRHTGASAEWDILVFVETDTHGYPLLVAEIPREEVDLKHDEAIQLHRNTMKNGSKLVKKYADPIKLEKFRQVYKEAIA